VAEEKPEWNSDAVLWGRIRAGEAAAFEGFYRDNARRLQGFLRLLTRNEQAAEDVMQETFTQIWRSPNGFQPERGSLRAYLYGIGRKRAADWQRKQPAGRPLAESVEQSTAANKETFAAINDAFARLTAQQQSLLWLREVEGQSYAELAEIFGIPTGTVRSRLFAAREELRKIWHGSSVESRNKP
jgi:RNA polymerase sigma-70 factor, ECF subfamily